MRLRNAAAAALALGALASPAHALDLGGSVSAELGRLHNPDPSWDLFSEGDGMPSRGLRGGVKLGPHLTVQGGWHRVARGADLRVPTFRGGGTGNADVRVAFLADQYLLGAQLALPLASDMFVPYASADGVVLRGVMKLDEDPDDRDNPNQVVGSGFSPGLTTTGGLELRTPHAPVGWQIAVFAELGYGWFATGDYGALGEMTPGGFTMRGGLGLRFP